MYGIIYKAIEKYVVDNFGNTTWETIKADSSITIDSSLMEQPYNDKVNHELAEITAQHTNKALNDVLFGFGESIIKTTSQNYSIFMESRGNNMKDYLINLPNFHNRIMLIYPELTPPEFRVSNVEDNCLFLHYISTTSGMLSFVKGYLTGLMKVFKETPDIKVISQEEETDKEYIFKICW